MIFRDSPHEEFYEDCVGKTTTANDPYHKALFYTLGLTKETRRNISSLYNFKEREIIFRGLNEGWQTSSSLRVSRMAFNLYNGFCGDIEDGHYQHPEPFTPYYLFDTGFMVYFFEAVKLRYAEYYQDITPVGDEEEGNE